MTSASRLTIRFLGLLAVVLALVSQAAAEPAVSQDRVVRPASAEMLRAALERASGLSLLAEDKIESKAVSASQEVSSALVMESSEPERSASPAVVPSVVTPIVSEEGPAPSSDAPAEVPLSSSSAGVQNSVVAKAHVNMRARPLNEATIVAVIPKGDTAVLRSCDGWCEVEFAGRSGYVWKDFLDRPEAQ